MHIHIYTFMFISMLNAGCNVPYINKNYDQADAWQTI